LAQLWHLEYAPFSQYHHLVSGNTSNQFHVHQYWPHVWSRHVRLDRYVRRTLGLLSPENESVREETILLGKLSSLLAKQGNESIRRFNFGIRPPVTVMHTGKRQGWHVSPCRNIYRIWIRRRFILVAPAAQTWTRNWNRRRFCVFRRP